MENDAEDVIVAYCGLVCSECGAYTRGRCQGCHSDKPMYRGCKVKPCAIERNCSTCAACEDFPDLRKCRKLNNVISKVFGFIFRSNRIANLDRIRQIGLDEFKASVGR